MYCMADVLRDKVSVLATGELSSLLQAMATLGLQPPPSLLSSLVAECLSKLSLFQPDDLVGLISALPRLGYTVDRGGGASSAARQVQPATARQVRPATARQVQPATAHQVQPATARQIQPATARQVQPATALATRLLQHTLPCLPALTPAVLTGLLAGLVRMGCEPPRAWAHAYFEGVRSGGRGKCVCVCVCVCVRRGRVQGSAGEMVGAALCGRTVQGDQDCAG